MSLKPWYTVVSPREDLRLGKPLDASEFAVHLDQIRDGRAPIDYQDPAQFFARTYLTQNLLGLASEVTRRLSGEKTGTSAVFNLATQFGGGKTHALSLLYHLAQHGNKAQDWMNVDKILAEAGINSVPKAAVAVFVGTEFDSLTGRGGTDGTPLRKTPWGELAFQIGGEKALEIVAEHEKHFVEPKGDVIRAFLPKDRPCLILLDEVINYVSTYRRMGYHNAFYNFVQALSEVVRGEDNVVLVVSIPASELEYTSEDEADEQRFKKMLDRVGKAFIMSAKSETSEIIRRRLFEWSGLPEEGQKVINAYARWIMDHRNQLPSWFPVDNPYEAIEATYPLHPMVLSVFERKWQALPRFQQTRGILRLLALWVSKAYALGYKERWKDPLISLGTAPLDEPLFRAAVFEQLGNSRMESVVTTDICGKPDSHAIRLDDSAVDTIKQSSLHKKIATCIFFESNGGQVRPEATLSEIRLALSEPDLDIGNIETVLETLTTSTYYLDVQGNRYHFSPYPNLNKIYADRRATVQSTEIEERMHDEIRNSFRRGTPDIEVVPFPERSSEVLDRPILTFVVLSPQYPINDPNTLKIVEVMTREYGTKSRVFKNSLVWIIVEDNSPLREATRKLLAWKRIDEEKAELRLSPVQKNQLPEHLDRALRDLKECVWRSYRRLALLRKDNSIHIQDLGLLHSSSATSLTSFVFNRLKQDGDVEDAVSPGFLVRNWPPVFKEWSVKGVRDAFFASPQFPRLINPEMAIRKTISKGVSEGTLAHVGKTPDGKYVPFNFKQSVDLVEIEITDDMFIITQETAEAYLQSQTQSYTAVTSTLPAPELQIREPGYQANYTPTTTSTTPTPQVTPPPSVAEGREEGRGNAAAVRQIRWSGEIPAQKWGNFYMNVLAKFANRPEWRVRLRLHVDITSSENIAGYKVEEMKTALRDLGLPDQVETDS